MCKRKFVVKNSRKRKIYLSLLLMCLLLIGLGYSNLVTKLGMNGNLGINHFDRTLYGVFMKAEKRGYAQKYTGEHQDSFSSSGDKDIYHWYATSDEMATEINNKNNVIFAGQCWQMLRSTDTGGVKMIYNGESDNNQCLSTRGNHLGYNSSISQTLSGQTYYYADDYTYDSTNQLFRLYGTMITMEWSDFSYESLVGKYTCLSSNYDDTCSTLYLVDKYESATNAYVIPINLNSHYSQYGNVQFNASASNNLTHVGYMYKNGNYSISKKTLSTATYLYASGFTYSNGVYTLNSDSVSITGTGADDVSNFESHRYTCLNDTGTCSTISYVFLYSYNSTDENGNLYYIKLEAGQDINDYFEEIYYGYDVNQVDSTIKRAVEAWYEKYLSIYDSFIEDTIFCNNRTISETDSIISNGFFFEEKNEKLDLSCDRVTDQFSTLNSSAPLKHKVGLMTASEMNLLNNDIVRATENPYWLISPAKISTNDFHAKRITALGSFGNKKISETWGVRPAISLKPGTLYSRGDGSMSNPYVVDIVFPDTLMQHDTDYSKTFGKNISRDSFESITTVNHITVPGNAIESWDASNNQNGSVMAWYTDTDSDSKYELYLGQEGMVKANVKGSDIFSHFVNLDSIDLTYFDTSLVEDMSSFFADCGRDSTVFTLDLGDHFDTSNVRTFGAMFLKTGLANSSFSLDLGDHFDTSNAVILDWMFYEIAFNNDSFTLDLGDHFDTSNVKSMEGTFNEACQDCSSFTLNLGDHFDTSNVIKMNRMFEKIGRNTTSFTLDLGNLFDTSKVINMNSLFREAGYTSQNFTLNLGNKFDTSKVIDMAYMFQRTGYTNPDFTLNLGNHFDTSKVIDMQGMFYDAFYSNKNIALDLGDGFVFTNVTDYTDIFHGMVATQKLYVKSATERNWIISNAGNNKLTTSNVLIRS